MVSSQSGVDQSCETGALILVRYTLVNSRMLLDQIQKSSISGSLRFTNFHYFGNCALKIESFAQNNFEDFLYVDGMRSGAEY